MSIDPYYLIGHSSTVEEVTAKGYRVGDIACSNIPRLELVVCLNTYHRIYGRSANGRLIPISHANLASQEKVFLESDPLGSTIQDSLKDDPNAVLSLLSYQCEAATRTALSFLDSDVCTECAKEITSDITSYILIDMKSNNVQASDLVRLSKFKVVVTITHMLNFGYDEERAIALAQMRSEEGRMRRTVLQATVEASFVEKECEVTKLDGGICTVCLEEFGTREKVVQIPCSHCFHKECIKKWLVEESNSCPLCRFEIK